MTTAERAPSAQCALLDSSLPHVWIPTRTFSAYPVHLAVALWLDDNVAKVSILVTVPLALQLRTQLTDIWPTLLLLSWQCIAVCAATVASCC